MEQQTYNHHTRDYYENVMDEWRPKMETAHPYAENKVWQQIYVELKRWIAERGLEDGRVLEVGCGTGLLQHLAPNYVGVDIAASSAPYMAQPFSVCSATSLPFPDNSFDGVWSIWVLEHIDDPEGMLSELRRVVRPGGSIFICAGYAVDTWVSQGLHKRPFRELTRRQQLTKLTIPVRGSIPYKILVTLPVRLRELLTYLRRRQPTALRYGKLEPNFETYWDYDADAVVSLDSYNVALYFLSRGDQPYSKTGVVRGILQRSQPQAYIVRK